MDEHEIIVAIVMVAGLGVAAQWLAWRLKLPAIVLLAAAGLLVGPGLGLLHPGDAFGDYFRPIVSLCVAIILFEGGLSLQLRELKVAAVGGRRLVYFGAPLAWLFSGLCAHDSGGLAGVTGLRRNHGGHRADRDRPVAASGGIESPYGVVPQVGRHTERPNRGTAGRPRIPVLPLPGRGIGLG
jgi:hypothetical protein